MLVALALAAAAPRTASAFCGFYVAGSDQKMFNDATQVVLMRMGTRTVLAMQNNYKGPPAAFAMVVPVPVVLHEGDVKTLPKEVFAHVEQMGAPRLVEYWEQDPCGADESDKGGARLRRTNTAFPTGAGAGSNGLGVTIEARFTVGEYQVLILSAKDSTGLETWLTQQKYQIPEGAEPLLRPYVESGSKFFVAKVDPAKVQFDSEGRAALSPLRFHYDSEDFTLPIRLGLASSSGTQDLIVNILAPHQRYEVNGKNVTIPTNLDVGDAVKARFPAFYAALFDRTIETHPGAVVTEYAWQASTCDPCPGPALNQRDFATLGADVLTGPKDKPAAYSGYDLVLTRLHARYGKTITDDLRFREASPIAGGRELAQNGQGGLEEGAQPSSQNNFQGRYAIRHPWTGPIRCEHPRPKRWGGPPPEIAQQPGFQYPGIKPALGVALAPRGEIQLAQVVRRDIPELGITAGSPAATSPATAGAAPGSATGSAPGSAATTAPTATTAPPTPPTAPAPATPPADNPGRAKSGCGCAASGQGDALGGLLSIGVGLAVVRRRRVRG
jgi:MYXO-CTERM domain-containing protein